MSSVSTQTVSNLSQARRASGRVLAASALLVGVLAAGQARASFEDDLQLPQQAVASQTTRAEVIADLNLWRRAGADRYAQEATEYQTNVQAYEQALAEYRRLRNGPAFAAEVAKVLGLEASTHARAR